MAASTAGIEATIIMSSDPSIVTVIERFTVTDDRKDEAIAAARTVISENWLNDPLFVAAALLRGRDHDGISSYVQWKRGPERLTPEAPPTSRSLAPVLSMFEVTESRTFSMDFFEAAEAGASSTRISMQETPHVHYGLFAMKQEDQNRVADLGRINSTQSIGASGLLSINWHRSLDGVRFINLGVWTNFDGLKELDNQDGFKKGDVYWQGIADWEAELFDVVAVVTHL